MRRVLKAVTLGREPGDITTIEDEGSVEEARSAWQQMKEEMASVPSFSAYRIYNEDGKIQGRMVKATVDELGAGEVVIKSAYSGVNYKDALAGTGAGRILKHFPLIGGIDVSGHVASSSDPRFKEGDEVLVTGCGLGESHDGGYSEFVRVPADWIVPVPKGMNLFDAMAIGTAGFTAGLSVLEMERNGLTPDMGPVIVTGSTGGVGSIAIQCLWALGYKVTALTRKETEQAYLKELGASEVLLLANVQMGTKPLEKAIWAGAVDAVGGDVLAWLTRTMMVHGTIASSGLTGGIELKTTVMPFILRGVKLLGVDSVACPWKDRLDVWRRLATDMKPKQLGSIAREIPFHGLPEAFNTLMKGAARGRFVVAVGAGAGAAV